MTCFTNIKKKKFQRWINHNTKQKKMYLKVPRGPQSLQCSTVSWADHFQPLTVLANPKSHILMDSGSPISFDIQDVLLGFKSRCTTWTQMKKHWCSTLHKVTKICVICCIRTPMAHMWPWTTKPVLSRWGIFVAIAKNTLHGSKLLIFLLCQKSLGH